MDCSPPGSSVHGVFQARIREWVAIPFSGDLPDPGIEPRSLALQADALLSEPPGAPSKGGVELPTWVTEKRVRGMVHDVAQGGSLWAVGLLGEREVNQLSRKARPPLPWGGPFLALPWGLAL